MRLIAALVLLSVVPGAARGQTPPTLDDSLLRAYAGATPCPAHPPAAWLKGDPEIAQKPTCPVVAMAAARVAADPDPLIRELATSSACVATVAMTGWGQATPVVRSDEAVERTPSSPREAFAVWGVTFVGKDSNSVSLSVNRLTGAVRHWTRAIDARNPMPKACR
jgi:hypothetical protein